MWSILNRGGHFRICVTRTTAILCVLAALEVLFLAYRWPFTRTKVTTALEHFALSKLTIREHHMTFFPEPGYVAEGLTFSRVADGKPVQMATVSRLQCRGSWLAMISLVHMAKELKIEGLRVSVPRPVPAEMHLHKAPGGKPEVQNILADGTILDIARERREDAPLHFAFSRLRVEGAASNRPVKFDMALRNPDPPADIALKGQFGPVNKRRLGQVPESGEFWLSHGQLSHYEGLSGSLAAHGSYTGTVENTRVRGSAEIPGFAVGGSSHCVGLSVNYEAEVNGLSGAVVLQNGTAAFLQTKINAQGSISARSHGNAKTVTMDMHVLQGRVEDLLFLFGKGKQTPLYGPISLHSHVVLPPGKEKFLRRVQLSGSFDITKARFKREETQEKVGDLSERARGIKPKPSFAEANQVFTSIQSDAVVKDGTARLSDVKFGVPGALAEGSGTFNLLSKAVNFSGTLSMQATLSEATSGWKAMLIKPFNKLFERNSAGAMLPISVTGTYEHPSFKLTLHKKG